MVLNIKATKSVLLHKHSVKEICEEAFKVDGAAYVGSATTKDISKPMIGEEPFSKVNFSLHGGKIKFTTQRETKKTVAIAITDIF